MAPESNIFKEGISIDEMSSHILKLTGSIIFFFDGSSCITSWPTLP